MAAEQTLFRQVAGTPYRPFVEASCFDGSAKGLVIARMLRLDLVEQSRVGSPKKSRRATTLIILAAKMLKQIEPATGTIISTRK